MALATKPKRNTPLHKKRSGKHHRQSKHYLKAYWPYLPMLSIIGLGIWVNSVWSQPSVLGASSDFSSRSLLRATNNNRASAKEPALTIDSKLAAAAQAKASDMVSKNYWSHNSPSGQTPWDFITAAGYQYQVAGENLAYGFGSANATVAAWMNSPEHRANILDRDYQNVGFGVASSLNYQGNGPEIIVVAEYAQPAVGGTQIYFKVANPIIPLPGDTGVEGAHTSQTELAAKAVSRVQVLTGGQANWSYMVVAALTASALTVFILRHGFRLRRALNRGELYLVHHPYIDIAIVFVITAGFLLTRTSGLIR